MVWVMARTRRWACRRSSRRRIPPRPRDSGHSRSSTSNRASIARAASPFSRGPRAAGGTRDGRGAPPRSRAPRDGRSRRVEQRQLCLRAAGAWMSSWPRSRSKGAAASGPARRRRGGPGRRPGDRRGEPPRLGPEVARVDAESTGGLAAELDPLVGVLDLREHEGDPRHAGRPAPRARRVLLGEHPVEREEEQGARRAAAGLERLAAFRPQEGIGIVPGGQGRDLQPETPPARALRAPGLRPPAGARPTARADPPPAAPPLAPARSASKKRIASSA